MIEGCNFVFVTIERRKSTRRVIIARRILVRVTSWCCILPGTMGRGREPKSLVCWCAWIIIICWSRPFSKIIKTACACKRIFRGLTLISACGSSQHFLFMIHTSFSACIRKTHFCGTASDKEKHCFTPLQLIDAKCQKKETPSAKNNQFRIILRNPTLNVLQKYETHIKFPP